MWVGDVSAFATPVGSGGFEAVVAPSGPFTALVVVAAGVGLAVDAAAGIAPDR